MLLKPFITAVYYGPDPEMGNLQVVVGIHDELRATTEARELVTRALDNLSHVAAWGGMAGELYQPLQSRMSTVVADLPIGAGKYLWGFECENIHPGILLVIKNLTQRVHLRVPAIESLELRSSLPRTGGRMAIALPCDYEPHGFPVDYDMTTAQVLVHVDFQGRHDPAALAGFRQAWEAWQSVAVEGGFADETYLPDKSTLHIEDDLQITSTGLSCAFDGVAIADAGFHCLVNMLQTFNHRLARIEQVTIE